MKITLAVLLLAATAHAEPAAPLDVTISGAIDPALLATSIASELRRPVTPRSDGCHAPCLAIAVDGQTATLTFTAETGATRQRTLALPADTAQWPTLVTLLAGNLVRDEADELLADEPPRSVATPPAPAMDMPPPPTPAAPVRVPLRWTSGLATERVSPFAFSLVPGASTDLLDLQRSHVISIGLVAESSGHVHGLAISGAVDVADGVDGAQIAGAVDVAANVAGAQIAGAATIAERARGTQIAGALALTDELRGTQVAGAVTIASSSRGSQIAGAVAIASESAGTQIAGALNVAGASAGMQIAGGINVARDSAGSQIAGGINVAGAIHGVQIAPINIARRNTGLQIGVLNVGGGPDGESFGLINIVPGGRTDLEAAVDSDRIGTLMLRHGGRHWHNVYGVGGQHVDVAGGMSNNDVWMLGAGFGPSFHIAGLPADLDAIAWHVNHGSTFDDRLSLLAQARLTLAIPIGRAALVAGGSIDTYVSTDHDSPLAIARTTGTMTNDVRVHVWPSAFVGVRL